MKTWSSHKHALAGGTGLVLAALLSGPAAAYPAQEPTKGAAPERAREPERPKQEVRQEPSRTKPAEAPKARVQPEAPAPGRPAPETRPGSRPQQSAQPRQAPMARPGPHPFTPAMEVVRTREGGEIHRGPGGVLREVRTPSGAVIHYAPDGMRRVEVARPDGRVFVASPNGRGGYVQRPYRFGGQAFVQRTYVMHGVVTARVYRPWVYGGVTYNVYMPNRYYRPAFYAWAWHPWPRPVYYPWGWAGQPWFGYYRGWYTPYPYYANPVFWLADFMIATTLEEAYQNRLDSGAASAPPPPASGGLTPDVQQAIADEVQRQVQQEQAQQASVVQNNGALPSGPPPLFSGNVNRIFMAYTSVPVYANGQEYFLSEGDVLQLRGAPPAGSGYGDVTVMASHNPSLPKGTMVSVSLQDLLEMQNHMMAIVDQGLGTLQTQQGSNGIPALPPQNLGAANAPYAAGIQADPNAAGELSQVATDAAQGGQDMLAQAPQPPVPAAPAPAPASGASLSLGMTMAQVHEMLGNPRQTANLGAKVIEVYPSLKVIYLNGVVTDIQ